MSKKRTPEEWAEIRRLDAEAETRRRKAQEIFDRVEARLEERRARRERGSRLSRLLRLRRAAT
jgi:hypothetical protein